MKFVDTVFNERFYRKEGRSMKNILQLKDVSKTFPNTSFKLNNISFSIPYGSIVGFIGENGAGKTTTMGTILGTLKKDSGTIYIFGQTIDQKNKDIKENIGVVFDQMNFSGNLNVAQLSNVFQNIYRQWDSDTFFHYINHFSLPIKDKIQGFSRGMSMKLSIAVALSHDAKLLILDEATAGLDPVAREEVLEVLLDFVKDKKRSILLSSHITSDIEKIADELIFIKKGEIILKVSKDELLNNYSMITCTPHQLKHINHKQIIAYKHQKDGVEVLLSRKRDLPPLFNQKDFSIDDIALLLMKGDKQ